MKKTALIAAAAVCLCTGLCGCTQNSQAAGSGASEVQNSDWYFCEIGYNTFNEPYHIADKNAAAEQLADLKSKPLNLTEDMTLTGFFLKDVSLKAENAESTSDLTVAEKTFEEASYGDCWYYTLKNPEEYLTLPDDVKPAYIRISYSPKGSIIMPLGEAIIISLTYENPQTSEITDAFALSWYHGIQS